MSTKYFILTQSKTSPFHETNDQEHVYFGNKIVHLLPYHNVDYYRRHGLFESRLIDWCKQFGHLQKNMVDIGAHSGTYTLCLAPYFRHVYAFEPQKMTYYSLCGGVALSHAENVTCYPFGLGSKEQEGEKTLHIVSPDGGGSTVQPSTSSRVLRTETITVRTLDSFQLDNIHFIKMDVEENELEVLKGAIETFTRCRFPTMLFESNFNNQPLFDWIRHLGYSIIQIQNSANMFLAEYKR